MKKNNKLTLGSERIASLSKDNLRNIQGGLAQAGSTNHNFTCTLCTGGDNGSTIQDYPSDATYTCTRTQTIA